MKYVIIHTTFPDVDAAKIVSDNLLQEKLIACSNFHMITSSYLDKGKIVNTDEITVLMKTTEELYEKAKAYIAQNHPYDIPDISRLDANANDEYSNWLKKELK